jgi:hypothetical protein
VNTKSLSACPVALCESPREAWHMDPLQKSTCQKQMRVTAFIDNPELVENSSDN